MVLKKSWLYEYIKDRLTSGVLQGTIESETNDH